MAVYVMLSRMNAAGYVALKERPEEWLGLHSAIERWEAKVLYDFQTMGKYDHCTIFEAPDNFHAYCAGLVREFSSKIGRAHV